MTPKIGVLALQGDVREHLVALEATGAQAFEVKTLEQIKVAEGLVIPGGESTTIAKLASIFGLFAPLQNAIQNGLPVFGTCAGLILLANQIVDGSEKQQTFGGLDAVVRRNAFGNQTDSFEIALDFKGIIGPAVEAAFIRAPVIESVGPEVEILSRLPDERIVAVRQGHLLGISFHPEIMGEFRVHEYFVDEIVRA